jgi:lichenan operon transcriptional antiterminator
MAYILLYILAAVERHKQEMKVNVIVICATGLGSAQMIKNRLENEFAQNFHIVDVISYYQLNDRKLENVDLIISTIDISTSFYHVPVVKVSVFLNKQDVDTLNAYIHSPKSPKQSLEGEGQAK